MPDWVSAQGGIPLESTYPYVQSSNANTAPCASAGLPLIPISLASDNYVSGTVLNLMGAINQQPVTVAIAGGAAIFQHYKSGVLASSACGSNVDHAVVAVGYGSYVNGTYIKIRNSWGTSWGIGGYGLLDPNYCEILSDIYYPILN